jgi:DNA polymerase-3 subunit epsilon
VGVLPLPYVVDVSGGLDDLRALPARAGVFVLEDEGERAVCLAITANVRRLVRARLAPVDEGAGGSRRVDYAAVTRTVRATTVGSAFEADWAYLQLARERMPETFRTLLDRWRGWFIHANPETRFPRFVKTSTPGGPPTGRTGVYLGPFPDKHAAQRAIESLQDLFDLCRYHHILVQAPEGNACAYKEMGKCPAPCDGTIGLEPYRDSVRAAVDFAADPEAFEEDLRRRMAEASERLDFEEAERLRRRLEVLGEFRRPAHRLVDRLEGFRHLAVLPGERDGWARLMLIVGGSITPALDVPVDAPAEVLGDVISAIEARAGAATVALTSDAVEHIGLVCWHLFRGRKSDGAFIHLRKPLDERALRTALRRLRDADVEESITEQSIEEADYHQGTSRGPGDP